MGQHASLLSKVCLALIIRQGERAARSNSIRWDGSKAASSSLMTSRPRNFAGFAFASSRLWSRGLLIRVLSPVFDQALGRPVKTINAETPLPEASNQLFPPSMGEKPESYTAFRHQDAIILSL